MVSRVGLRTPNTLALIYSSFCNIKKRLNGQLLEHYYYKFFLKQINGHRQIGVYM